MSRARNLVLFALAATLAVGGGAWLLRDELRARLFGVSFDAGPGGRAELSLPSGYRSNVFAQGLSGPRFMAVAPDGLLYVAERDANRVVVLPDADEDGVADETRVVGTGYGRAHSLAFEADGRLLVAGETTLYRVTLGDGGREASREIVLDGLPGGGHATRTVTVLPDGNLLLSVGSSCNVCEEADARRGSILLVDAATGEHRISMRGMRNAVGLWVDPRTGRGWATNMGRDRLGDDRPPETLYEVVDGADAGWPRCHAGSMLDPEFGDRPDPVTGRIGCEDVLAPAATFQAHAAPLALVGWEDRLVIAFHGSWNRSSKVGYEVLWLAWNGAPAGPAEPLATGFLPDGSDSALGRPAGLAVGADGALYVSDDKAGYIYRIATVGG